MRSPNQRMNILPAARMMVAGNMNTGQLMPEASAAPDVIFKLMR